MICSKALVTFRKPFEKSAEIDVDGCGASYASTYCVERFRERRWEGVLKVGRKRLPGELFLD